MTTQLSLYIKRQIEGNVSRSNQGRFFKKSFRLRSHSIRLAICLYTLLLTPMLSSCTPPVQQNPGTAVVTRYITAIQTRDRKTIIDLANFHQENISGIKANNPQVLWPRLIKDYYDTQIKGTLDSLAQSVQELILPTSKWRITETRSDQGRAIVVYVTVDYPTLDESPLANGRFLKEAILEFDLDSRSHFLTQVRRLPQGDTAWETTPLMIMNAMWFAEGFSGIHLNAHSIGGTAPFSWSARCGSSDPSNSFDKFDGSGTSLDPYRYEFSVDFRSDFKDNQFPLPCIMSVTDAGGQTDAVRISVPKLFTGLINPYCWGRPPWSHRGQAGPYIQVGSSCQGSVMDFEKSGKEHTESSLRSESGPANVQLSATSGQSKPAQSNPHGDKAAERATLSALVSCSDYNSCLSAGNQRLFHDEDRSSAIPYFQHALDYRKDPTGWIYLGTAYLRAGRPADVSSAWDEVMKINKQIGMPLCSSNGFGECESGMLVLGPKNVTWQVAGRTVFDIPAMAVKVFGNEDHHSEGYISFGLEVDGTKYDFEFVTLGNTLNKGSKHAFTDAQGIAQQRTVGDYVSQTIPRLASGAF